MQEVQRKKVKETLRMSLLRYLVTANLLFPFEAQHQHLHNQY